MYNPEVYANDLQQRGRSAMQKLLSLAEIFDRKGATAEFLQCMEIIRGNYIKSELDIVELAESVEMNREAGQDIDVIVKPDAKEAMNELEYDIDPADSKRSWRKCFFMVNSAFKIGKTTMYIIHEASFDSEKYQKSLTYQKK